MGRSEEGSTSYSTSYYIESVHTGTIYKILKKNIPRPLPTINIIGEKRSLRNENDLGLYKKTLKPFFLKKYEGKSLREY